MTATLTDVSERTFDYIIVGGGTAGLVLASRLSEESSVSVLVLEAGEANLNDPNLLIPWGRLKYLNNPKYDWAFKTVKQPSSGGRTFNWPRGKGLGGSSAINYMLWNKPAREFIDAFEELGNPGWNWDSFNKYSQRAEKFVPPKGDTGVLKYDLSYRGRSGPIVTCFPPLRSNLEETMLQTLATYGIEQVQDPSSGFTNGAAATAYTTDPATYQRTYSANMYYTPASTRQNLTVLVLAQVSRILTRSNDDGTLTATGVQFHYDGQEHNAYSAKEVCLCAGAIMSPQILELSGIGDRDVLQKAGIDLNIDLPGVGANVQEHLYTGIVYELGQHTVNGREVHTIDPLLYPEEQAKHLELFASGKGVYNLNAINMSFVPLESVCENASDMNKTVSDNILDGIKENQYSDGLRKQYEIQLKFLQEKVPSLEIVLAPGPTAAPQKPDVNKKHISLCFALNSPFSRGSIHVASKDPLAQPVIDPHVFEQEYDLDVLVELVKFCRKLAKTEPLRSVLSDEVFPGPGTLTDDQIADWLKKTISTTFHTVGSCSMLPLQDGGVVDPKLKVYNTTNIRIVDLSIVPLHVGCHTVALAYAIAEQAADVIKGLL